MKALIISNGIEGLEKLYQSNHQISYDIIEVEQIFNPDFKGYKPAEWLIGIKPEGIFELLEEDFGISI